MYNYLLLWFAIFMKDEESLLGLPQEEVKAAMQEEGCGTCFECPYATLLAAAIAHRHNMLLNFTYKHQVMDSSLHTELEDVISSKRLELNTLTSNCSGYSAVKRETGRPANMCDSPGSPDTQISVIAGRILEFFRLP